MKLILLCFPETPHGWACDRILHEGVILSPRKTQDPHHRETPNTAVDGISNFSVHQQLRCSGARPIAQAIRRLVELGLKAKGK
ncbi:hypothetical protein [Nitrobacter sp. TKz-YC02]|uniref:hypothetical protein n=1 Tax=Nitrobacter sp. TKz-YC02 TaxID=3398704 RepID=UPI003CF1B40F